LDNVWEQLQEVAAKSDREESERIHSSPPASALEERQAVAAKVALSNVLACLFFGACIIDTF
jgi:hypothetical protein